MKRRHSLYLLVINSGPLVILQAPAEFLRWSDHRKAILSMMRREHGVKAADVHAVEGLAGSPDGDPPGCELGKLRETFSGLRHGFVAFHLYAWDGAAYVKVREPLAHPQGLVVVKGPFPPPKGVYGPHARREATHVYQVFNSDGLKMVGGTFGPDPAKALAYALSVAAQKGYPAPRVEIIPATE